MININIKNARKAKGFSQEEMAVRLNVVRQTVSKWEKGLSVPNADLLIKISDLLEVSVNDLLGVENNELKLYKQADKKRGLILLISFIAMLFSMRVKNELVSIIVTGGCILATLIILYRNFALLTRITTADMKISTLKITTMFNIAIILTVVVIIALDRAAIIRMTESDEKLFSIIVVSIILLFGGFISPKLPFSRHTGLRLPWTVQDEDTWNVAHKMIGYISLPVVLLYLTASCTISNLEAVTVTAILLWIAIPGLISFVFWRKKFHG